MADSSDVIIWLNFPVSGILLGNRKSSNLLLFIDAFICGYLFAIYARPRGRRRGLVEPSFDVKARCMPSSGTVAKPRLDNSTAKTME